MAIVLGVSAGFVTTAPSVDPLGSTIPVDTTSRALKDTSPAGTVKITEIGWYSDNATQEANYEVGLYSEEGDDEPETRLFVDATNAKGTGSGWKTVAVDWTISASTTYWIAFQLDDTATATQGNITFSAGAGGMMDSIENSTSLPNPWGTSTFDQNFLPAIYALVEIEEPTGFTRKIKISGTFQDKPIKTKVGGSFVDKITKIKVGGTFQDA